MYFLSSLLKQREVTNFANGGNLTPALCKTGYFPHRIFGIFLFKIKILLYKFLENLPQYICKVRNFIIRFWDRQVKANSVDPNETAPDYGFITTDLHFFFWPSNN